LPEDNEVLRSHKLSKRFDQDISAVCVAYRLQLEDDRVASFRMACGGMAATIRRAFLCEAEIEGQYWNEETLNRATDALKKDFAPISDMRASGDYRLKALQNLLRRFYLESRGELTETLYSYGRGD
jgi:xanthine dehydrogenase small subunit